MVIWVWDAKVAIPARWRGAVTYTLTELEALAGVTPEGLKKLHQAKKTFRGKIGPSGEEF